VRTAIAMEVEIEQGVDERLVFTLTKQAERLRAAYNEAVDTERAAVRRIEELGPKQQCIHCISTPDREHTFLCGMHTAALDRLKTATAIRIGKQRALGETEYALDRARKGLR
jgi:hypothetical protein